MILAGALGGTQQADHGNCANCAMLGKRIYIGWRHVAPQPL